MKTSTNNQNARIINFCKIHGSITQRQALRLGIYRLASRIHDLRAAGYLIHSEMITVNNADGSTSRVAKYTILRDILEGL